MTIDWRTLALQTINVLVLIWLLGRYFWRPVSGMIEQRRQAAHKLLADAQAERNAAIAARQEIERTRAGLETERDKMIAAARDEAQHTRNALIEAAGRDADALRAAAIARIDQERTEVDAAWAERASRLALEIAQRLASRLSGPLVRDIFLDWLSASIRALPSADRAALASGETAIEAVSATPLDGAEQAKCRSAIAEACGGRPQLTFSTDPALIAGLELRAPHLTVSNSWRADLDKILKEIAQPAEGEPH